MNHSVFKFGGTSVRDFQRMKQVAEIIDNHSSGSLLVIASATAGTTNSLQLICEKLRKNISCCKKELDEITSRHLQIVNEFEDTGGDMHLRNRVKIQLRYLKQSVLSFNRSDREAEFSFAEILGYGELLSTTILTEDINLYSRRARWLDVRRLMIANGPARHAIPDSAAIKQNTDIILSPMLEGKETVVVTAGFIGRNLNGQTVTLGRGGSDYSASLLGAALNANQIQIWTDVDGVMTADPQQVCEAQVLDSISYDEASDLAISGARVLHPSTLLPARLNNIPVIVRNTLNPSHPGTLISNTLSETASVTAKSISYQRNVISAELTILHDQSHESLLQFMSNLQNNILSSVLSMTLSQSGLSLIIRDNENRDQILQELKQLGTVRIEKNLALIRIVGDRLREREETTETLVTGLQGFSVRFISSGNDNLGQSILIKDNILQEALTSLHRVLFEGSTPAERSQPCGSA
ncbi:MAG: aspartate kinase [Calditrichota bacterium]